MSSSVVLGTVLLMLAASFAVMGVPASAALTPEWEYETPMGGSRAFPVIVQDDEGLVYVIGGVVNGTLWDSVALTNSYNPDTGAWRTLAPMTEGLRWATGALGHDGKIYVFAGWNDTHGALYAPVQIYDPESDSWSTGASIPVPVSFACAVTLEDGKIYVMGGRDSSYTIISSVQVYDPATDTWGTTYSMPAARMGGSAVKWQNGIIYTGGYDSGGSFTASAWMLWTSWGWNVLSSMPSTKTMHASVVGMDGGVYVMGGGSEWSPSSESLRYNYYSNEWTTLPDLNFARTYVSSAASTDDGRILVLGGTDMSVNVLATNLVESLQIMTESIALSSGTVDQGGYVTVTVSYDFAYETLEWCGMYGYLLADDMAYSPTYVDSPYPWTFSFQVSVPQEAPIGAHQIILDRIWVGYDSGEWNLGSREFPILVLSALSLEEQISILQDDITALADQLDEANVDIAALAVQLAALKTQLTALLASQDLTMDSMNATLADLQSQIDALQDKMDDVEAESSSNGTYGLMTMVLVIVVIVLLALMFVMGRKKTA